MISDLHLGTRSKADLLGRPDVRRKLLGVLEAVDQLVLLGDLVELRDAPLADALTAAGPFFDDLSEAMAGRRVTIVTGNHDYQLAAPWLERRRAEGGGRPLGLEQLSTPSRSDPLARLARRMGATELVLAHPGVWLRPDVYATHGHYLDCHDQTRTFECLARAVTETLLREPRGGYRTPDDYERVLVPLYRLVYRLAQSPRARRAGGVGKSLVRALEGRRGYRGPRGRANRLRPGLAAMAQVIDCLGIEADYVLFGHLHRPGPLDGESAGWTTAGGTELVNTGSWVSEPGNRPGTCVFVGTAGPPELRQVLPTNPPATPARAG